MSFIQATATQLTDITINGKSFTNDHGVPKEMALFAAYHSTLYSGNPPREGKLSTTTIIGPLRKAIYAILNPESATIDVMKLLASAKGIAMHSGMTAALTAADCGYVCEQRMEAEVANWKISGEFDILTPNKQIKDLKFVSNYNLKKLQEDQAKLEPGLTLEQMYEQLPTYFKYQAQLSIYYYLLNDHEVKPYGSIIFSLNNGSDMGKYTIDSEVTFPLWPRELTEQFITDRIKLIKQHLANGTLPECSPAERGYNPPSYKLSRMGPSGKMSTVRGSIHNNESEFRAFIRKSGKPGDQEIIEPAKYILCNYCNFANICTQGF